MKMRAIRRSIHVLIVVVAGGALIPASGAHARMPDHQEYLSALRAANDFVQKQKERESASQAVSSSIVKSVLGRYYEVGDQWDVAAVRFDRSTMRMTADPAHLKDQEGPVGIFHYEVIEVTTGAEPRVVIRVTQKPAYGFAAVDPRVETLTLTMNDRFAQSEKAYQLKGAAEPARVPPTGVRSALTPLEMFPLDVPDIATAERRSTPRIPELTPKIRRAVEQGGAVLESPSGFERFTQQDFFGRTIEVYWKPGEPWPTYIRTPQGAAVLMTSRGEGR